MRRESARTHGTRRVLALAIALGISVRAAPIFPHEEETEVVIDTPLAHVAATIRTPDTGGAGGSAGAPCVIMAGGTLSQGRNGELFAQGAPPRDALARLARALSAGGYASLRYDRVGFGRSDPKPGWRGSYAEEARVLADVMTYARSRTGFTEIIVAGESAGGYLACLAAQAGAKADAYLFLGAHCGSGEEIYACNFGRLVTHVESFPENLIWAGALRRELALGRHFREMFTAAAKGETTFELVDGDLRMSLDLARRREELDLPPDRMFRHIDRPALAVAGEFDLNVAPDHAERAARIMRSAGNERAGAVVIEGADHSFQQAATSEHERIRERFTLDSFKRPYLPRFYREIIAWLRSTAPSAVPADLSRLDAIAARHDESRPAGSPRAESTPEIESLSEYVPERVHLSPGIEIVEDITDKGRTAAVETLEGRIGPLLLGDGCQAHFIDMPGGMYVEEHPHSSESLIYTVRGSWVLCSGGRRHLMKPGSLFRFAARTPTGYEVPFAQDAYLLIFKGDRLSKSEKEFIDYLRGMRDRLRREQADGVPYLLRDLPPEHPARLYARDVNPEFERTLPPGK